MGCGGEEGWVWRRGAGVEKRGGCGEEGWVWRGRCGEEGVLRRGVGVEERRGRCKKATRKDSEEKYIYGKD